MKKKLSVFWKLVLVFTALILIGGGLSFIPVFCDWWGDHVHPFLEGGIGRVNAHLPFVLGEWLIAGAILLGVLSVIFLILLPFLRKKQGYRRFARGWYKAILMILVSSVLAYTFVWFIPFRGTVLGQGNITRRTEFGFSDLQKLITYSAEGLNAAAEEIPIDEDGTVQFPTVEENRPKITAVMQSLSGEFSRLSGFYPPVKTSFFSELLDHLRIGGVTFPLTGEAIHSKYSLEPHYQPVLDAHELSHFKGYYNESDANFLSQLAMTRSEDPYLRFSGYLDMMNYLDGPYNEARAEAETELQNEGKLPELPAKFNFSDPDHLAQYRAFAEKSAELLGMPPSITERAGLIIEASYNQGKAVYEADSHPLDEMPAVSEIVSDVADVGWETQAAVLKEHCYDGVTLLLLQYFDGKL